MNTADTPVHQLFEAQARRSPHAVAVESTTGQLTYQELNNRADQLAHHLRQQGLEREGIVGLQMVSSPELVVAMLGTLKAGGAFLCLDPAYPDERLKLMRNDAEAWLVLQHIPDTTPTDAQGVSTAVTDLAYLNYTSGSTGKPKGVLQTHRSISFLVGLHQPAFNLGPGTRLLQFASPSSANSTVEILTALCTGSTLCLASREALLPGPALLETLRDRRITNLHITPSALAVLPDAKLPDLRILTIGGEPCAPAVVNRWAPGRHCFLTYGTTEVSWVAFQRLENGDTPMSIGPALAGVNAYVLGPEMQRLPAGERGELFVGGVGLGRGYLRRPELNAERLVRDPFEPAQRLYRTGDIASMLSDGSIVLHGRIDSQVQIHGFRVELGEVSVTLSEHPEISEAVVVVRDDCGIERRLVAYLVPTREPAPSPEMLREYLANRLPSHMLPTAFVPLERMPLNPNRKLDRAALPPPLAHRPALDIPYTAPATPTERSLAALWEDVMKLSAIGIDDDFFALGGTSLDAGRMLARLEVRVEWGDATTIRTLAAKIDRHRLRSR